MFNSKLIGTNNAGGGPLPPATADGEYMVAGTNTGVLYISNTFGASWIERHTFPSASSFSHLRVSNDGQKILVRQGTNIYISTDTGVNFTQIGSGNAADMSMNGNYIYRNQGSGIFYRSTNNGASWIEASYGNVVQFSTNYYGDIIHGKNACCNQQYFSTNYGGNWASQGLSGIQSNFYTNPTGQFVSVRKDGQLWYKKTANGTWTSNGAIMTTNAYANNTGGLGLYGTGTVTYYWYNTNLASSGESDNATLYAGDYYGGYNARVKPDGVYVNYYITPNPNLYTKTLSLSGITSLDVSKLV
jgi:hypothetical protein